MVCLLCDFRILLTVFNQSYNCQTSHYLGRNRLPKPFLILPFLALCYCCLNLVLQILCANQPAYYFLNQIRLRLPLPCSIIFFQVRQDTCLFINIRSEPIMAVLWIQQTKKINKRTIIDFQQSDYFTRFQSSYAPYQTSTHFTAYSSSLSCEKRERKKKYLLLALAVGLTPHNYFTAVKHECTEWFLNPNMSHYFYNPAFFATQFFFEGTAKEIFRLAFQHNI